MRKHFGFILGFLWSGFIVLHWFFTVSHLYWYYDNLDILMHTSGGFLVIASWFYLHNKPWFENYLNRPIFHPLIILAVLVIGWEIHQLLSGKPIKDDYFMDTTLDMIIGLVSGLIAFKWFSSRTIDK